MPQFLTGYKCVPAKDGADWLRLAVTGDMACDLLLGESSPLYQRLYSQGLINGSFGSSFDLLPGAAYAYAGGDSNDPAAVMEAILEEARRLTREGLDSDYWQRMKRGNFGASLKGLNSFDSIAISLVEGCFQHFDPLRFPEIYDSITPQDVLDFIREHICRSRAALSVIYPKED